MTAYPNDPSALNPQTTFQTGDLYALLVRRLSEYSDAAGSVTMTLGAVPRIYVRAVIGPPTFPYAVLRFDRTSVAGMSSYKERGRLEVQIIGKPESQLPLVEWTADLFDRCLLALTPRDPAAPQVDPQGVIYCSARDRQTLPRFTDPADGSVVAVRCVYDILLWPRALSRRIVP